MFPNQMDLMVRKERNKDLMREAEHERLVGTAGGTVSGGTGLLSKVAAWIRSARVSTDPFLAPPTLTAATGQ